MMKVFAERLKELRMDNKLSLKDLARELGVSDIAISRWENELRIPNIENLVIIARFLE